MKKILLACFISFFTSISSVWAGFDEGLSAYNKKDYSAAFKEWLPLAKKGDVASQYNLGVMYKNGRGVKKDDSKAVEWYTKAAEQGHASAQNNLALMYENGRGVKKDDSKAVEWYTKAAEQGYSLAQTNLAFMYENGRGVKKDDSKAVEWYTKAAEQGYSLAQTNLALMYGNGRGVKKDDSKAVEWYTKAAEQGHSSAQNNLALMYENGRGVKKDHSKAVEWYTKSAKQGNKTAQKNLKRLQEKLRCQKPQADDIALFNLALHCADRDSMRTAVKKAGGNVKQEDKNKWGDFYFSSSLLKDSSELYISYTVDDKGLALAQYTFPSSMDMKQVSKIADMVKSKYGAPDKTTGNVRLGGASFVWNLKGGIELKVSRGWPNTTTYLSYKHLKNYKAQQAEMKRQKKEKEQKQYNSQTNNF